MLQTCAVLQIVAFFHLLDTLLLVANQILRGTLHIRTEPKGSGGEGKDELLDLQSVPRQATVVTLEQMQRARTPWDVSLRLI